MGGVGCDNMTVILACFLQGATYAELAERCSQMPTLSEGETGRDSHHLLSYQSKDMTYHHSNDPLDLRGRGVSKIGPGIRMNELHPQFDSGSTSADPRSNGLKEPQQLSCTV